jgi:hypothetical protein
MARFPWRIQRPPRNERPARPRVDPSNINTIPPYRLDANLLNGVWLHPTTVTPITELEQWYDLEFRIPVPRVNERWPR